MFRNLVRICLGEEALPITRMRSCSKKAREYMLLYKALKDIDIDKIESGITLNKHSILETAIKRFQNLKSQEDVIGVYWIVK